MPLDRRAERLLAMLEGVRGARAAPEPPESRRASLRSLAAIGDDTSAPARSSDRAFDGPASVIPVRLYEPADAGDGPLPGLAFFHGGGWVAGDLDTHDGLCRRLCAASGWRLLAVHYRRAPEHRFPAAFDDCLAATHWMAANARRLGVDAERLGVGGDSTGAGLAAAVAMAAREAGAPPLELQLLICPILDVASREGSRMAFRDGHFISAAAFARDLADYAAGVAKDNPSLSPLAAASLAGLPPAIVHTAEFDPFRDEGEAYAARLQRAGVTASMKRHAGMIHYFYALARAIPYARDAADEIGAQMREMAGRELEPQ